MATRKHRAAPKPKPKPDSCGICRFYLATTAANGVCRRFPAYRTKDPSHWCGEFAKAVH